MKSVGYLRSLFEAAVRPKPSSSSRPSKTEAKEDTKEEPLRIKIPPDGQSKNIPVNPDLTRRPSDNLKPRNELLPPVPPSDSSSLSPATTPHAPPSPFDLTQFCSISEIPFGVHVNNEQLTSNDYKVVVTPEAKETSCTVWLSNGGESNLVIELTMAQEVGKSFSISDPPKQIILAAGTSQPSGDNEFILICNSASIALEASAVITVTYKRQGTDEQHHFGLRVHAKGLSAAENLLYTQVPLRYIPDKWHLVAEDVVNPERKELVEMTLGLHCSLAFLSRLYLDLDHIPGWSEVKDRVIVSLIKDTSDCGNSSVSMGLAWKYFKKYVGETIVVFLNCGTGGVKLQAYLRVARTVTVLFEHKPGQGSIANIMGIGDYRPQKKKQTLDEVKTELKGALQTFHDWKKTVKTAWSQKRPYAFITGSIRNHWEKATEDMKQEMEHKLIELFGSDDPNQGLADPVAEILNEDSGKQPNYRCFFMTEHDEGRMESVGVRAMLKTVDKLQRKQDSKGRVDPVAILGIGTGSSRLTTLLSKRIGQIKRREFIVIPHEAGMPDTLKLLQLGSVLVSDPRISKLVEACLDAIRAGRVPVIALKSGALIRLWDDAPERRPFVVSELERRALTEPPTLDYFKVRGPNKKSRAVILSTTTLSRFASESSKQDKSDVDYLVARQDGVKLDAGAYGHMAVEFMRAPPKPERNTCYIGPTDHIVWEGIPSHVWWWPWRNKAERDAGDACEAPLLIRLPFVLLKDFLPAPAKETVVTRFEHLFKTFLGHEATIKATSYECICRVYRLLHEARTISETDASRIARDAVLFAGLTPKYDKDDKVQFQQSRSFVIKELAIAQPTGWRALNHENPLEWVHPKTPFRQTSKSVEQNRRKAWFLLEPFARSLQAVCDSKLLRDFSDLGCVANVKSQEGLRRKIDDDKKDPHDIYDYLRGTIYVGKGGQSMKHQVMCILDAIACVAEIQRIKWDHCEKDKGFIIVNVLFTVENTTLLSEVQIRLPSKKSTSAPPDDHLKHEAARTFGSYLAQSMSFGTAVATFFSLPCKHNFREFGRDEKIAVRELESGEIEVLRSEHPPAIKPVFPVDDSKETKYKQWSAIIAQFVGVIQSLTEDQQAESVLCPVYVNRDLQVQFYTGVREGVKVVQAALREENDFKRNESAEFVSDELVFRWLAGRLKIKINEESMLKELVEELKRSEDVVMMGQVAAWRFCCRNPFLYKTLKEEKTEWGELFSQDKPKARAFGILAALFRVGDAVHTAWMGEEEVRWLPSVYIIGVMGKSAHVNFAKAMEDVKTHNIKRKAILKKARESKPLAEEPLNLTESKYDG